jgi:uncharacterized membrane protein YkvA (DUF1232 family)
MLERLRRWARALKRDIVAVAIAVRDPRTPWLTKALGLAVVAYALSPIDLIPDFIPVLGLLDDLILVPLGLWLVVRMLPPAVLEQARQRADDQARLPRSRAAAAFVISVWVLTAVLLGLWWWQQ